MSCLQLMFVVFLKKSKANNDNYTNDTLYNIENANRCIISSYLISSLKDKILGTLKGMHWIVILYSYLVLASCQTILNPSIQFLYMRESRWFHPHLEMRIQWVNPLHRRRINWPFVFLRRGVGEVIAIDWYLGQS